MKDQKKAGDYYGLILQHVTVKTNVFISHKKPSLLLLFYILQLIRIIKINVKKKRMNRGIGRKKCG